MLHDGWLYTGDMARRDAEGYYTIVDRKRDIIKTSGFLVFPAEVEEVMRAFPGVAEAAVIGVPDPERGELVKALVVPRGDVKLDVAALEAHCRLHLGKHKRPRRIEVVTRAAEELPRQGAAPQAARGRPAPCRDWRRRRHESIDSPGERGCAETPERLLLAVLYATPLAGKLELKPC